MNPKLYVDPNCVVKYIEDCPVEPPHRHTARWYEKYSESHNYANPIDAYNHDVHVYQAALSKAKQEAVEFADQGETRMRLNPLIWNFLVEPRNSL